MSVSIQSSNKVVTKKAKADVNGPSVKGSLELVEFNIEGALYVELKLSVKGDPAVITPGKHAVHFHEKAAAMALSAPEDTSIQDQQAIPMLTLIMAITLVTCLK